MTQSRTAIIGTLVVALLFSVSLPPLAADAPAHSASLTPIQVRLATAHVTTSWDDRASEPEPFELPVLYLHHEREATSAEDRTLTIEVSGMRGGQVAIEARSLHTDRGTGAQRLETASFSLPNRWCTVDSPCSLRWTLPPSAISDLYTLRVKDGTGDLLWASAHPEQPDLALLDTWDVPVDGYTVRLTYAALFPFAKGPNDVDRRLRPAEVTDFFARQFAPLVLETWQTQFHTWGFGPIAPSWDADGIVEIFVTTPPFALFDGTGTYTVSHLEDGTPYPERRLWWYSNIPNFAPYDTLENAYKAVFAHEFFHMVQWNAILSAGGLGQGWQNVFIEAQGKFAPSVQYPQLELQRGHVRGAASEYGMAARHFLQTRLNTSYRDMEADGANCYDGALYWRFLYEQSGDMRIVRAALEEMALRYRPDIDAGMAEVMDAAFARVGGPFASFEESLTAFAVANYGLRLENGRCAAETPGACGGRYLDPDSIYNAPPLEARLEYEGGTLAYSGSVPALGGTDLIEVQLDRGLPNQPLTIAFEGQGARFSVQVWKLYSGREDDPLARKLDAQLDDSSARPRALTPAPDRISTSDHGVAHFSDLDSSGCDRLALIVTRLDAAHDGSTGDYRLTITAPAE
jgi:hypothetical protein